MFKGSTQCTWILRFGVGSKSCAKPVRSQPTQCLHVGVL